jgi:ABC-2 type transport system ATP-binding protein
MVAAMMPPSAGHILVGGFDTVSQRAEAKQLMGYMPQRFGLYTDLTVRENIDFFLDIHGVTGRERVRRRDEYLASPT